MDLLLLNRSIFASQLQTHTSEIKSAIIDEQIETRAMILDLVKNKGISQETSASYVQSTAPNQIESPQAGEARSSVWKWLLDSLGFPTMQNRQEEIAPASRTTFDWILKESSGRSEDLPLTNLLHWLRSGHGIYWVNGKAGSGKSTLMKYIFNDRRTSGALSLWAGVRPVLVASFFFWNSGTREQRSQTGLLRSLLFQILQHQPHLAPSIFPEENARLQSINSSDLWNVPKQPWTLRQLQMALFRRTELRDLPMKVCLFIDGLDEFEGNDEQNDHSFLVELLRSLSNSPSIKICASSRPLLIFEKAFRQNPGLRLQDLTMEDIRHYVFDKLTNDPRMKRISMQEPLHQHDFIADISSKAQGVFLWVKLVVRSLLDGLGNQDRMQDLKARLKMLPADLEQLYRHMFLRIEPMYLQKASAVFQLVRKARQIQDLHRKDGQRTTPVTVLQLALALESSGDTPRTEWWTPQTLTSKCDKMRGRMQIWCAGLLEVPDFIWNRLDPTDPNAALKTKITWEVAYLHRTARDFLESQSMWDALLSYTANTAFEPCTRLLRSTVRLYKIVGPLVATPLGYGLFRKELLEPMLQALIFAQQAETVTGDTQYETLQELDQVAGSHLVRWSGSYFGHWSQYVDRGEISKPYRSFLDLAIAYDLPGYVVTKVDCDHREFLDKVRQGFVRENPRWVQDYFKRHQRETNIEEDTRDLTIFDIAGKGLRYYQKQRAVLTPVYEPHPVTLLGLTLRPPCPSPSMAKILLERGADPNEISDSSRLWEQILQYAQSCPKRSSQSGQWLEIIRLFLIHGVDPRGYDAQRRQLGQDFDTAKTLTLTIVNGFAKEYPEEVVMLNKLVEQKLPWSKRRKVRTWTLSRLAPKS